jgi:hypothetical protein
MNLDSSGLAEILSLCDKAIGPGLTEAERGRWRLLTSELFEVLKNINPSGSQRRRQLRAVATLSVDVTAPAELHGLMTSTIGGGGLSISIADPPAVGTKLEFSIRVASRPAPIRAKGEVVWARQTPAGEFGVAFTEIDALDQDVLDAVVLKRLSETRSLGY